MIGGLAQLLRYFVLNHSNMPKRPRDPPLKGTVFLAHIQSQSRKQCALDDLPLCQRILLEDRQKIIDETLANLERIREESLKHLGASAKKHPNKKSPKSSSEPVATVSERVASLFKNILN